MKIPGPMVFSIIQYHKNNSIKISSGPRVLVLVVTSCNPGPTPRVRELVVTSCNPELGPGLES